MEQDIKKEARRQYIKYFRVWFIVIGILLLIWLVGLGLRFMAGSSVRKNMQAPTERVYDLADVLTDAEEESLRVYIGECEKKARMDIVLVTMNEDIEAMGYSYNTAIMKLADDFYDENLFGYDMVHGDGVLLLDNWREGQMGSWLSTCGRLVDEFGYSDREYVLDEVYYEIENDPYEAYRAYVKAVTRLATGGAGIIPIWAILIVPAAVALIFAFTNLKQSKAKDTTNSKTYVVGGKPVMSTMRDDFIRKHVVSRRIETSNSSGGGRSRGGGSHRSSSGVRHGGSGRRR